VDTEGGGGAGLRGLVVGDVVAGAGLHFWGRDGWGGGVGRGCLGAGC